MFNKTVILLGDLMKKIAFVGAHGTGKTTVVKTIKRILEAEGYSVESTKEAARSCPFQLDANANFASQFYILSTQINEENAAALKDPDFILADRCALDSLVYWNLIKEKEFKKTLETSIVRNQSAAMEALFKSVINEFDLIFYFKISEFEWLRRNPSDGVRSTDLNWYATVSDAFDSFIKKRQVKVVEISSDSSLQEIVETVMGVINDQRWDKKNRPPSHKKMESETLCVP
jgi:thymidylate kinase